MKNGLATSKWNNLTKKVKGILVKYQMIQEFVEGYLYSLPEPAEDEYYFIFNHAHQEGSKITVWLNGTKKSIQVKIDSIPYFEDTQWMVYITLPKSIAPYFEYYATYHFGRKRWEVEQKTFARNRKEFNKTMKEIKYLLNNMKGVK